MVLFWSHKKDWKCLARLVLPSQIQFRQTGAEKPIQWLFVWDYFLVCCDFVSRTSWATNKAFVPKAEVMPLLSYGLSKGIITYTVPLCPKHNLWGYLVLWKKYIISLDVEIFLFFYNSRLKLWLSPKVSTFRAEWNTIFGRKEIMHWIPPLGTIMWVWHDGWGLVADLKEHSRISVSILAFQQCKKFI